MAKCSLKRGFFILRNCSSRADSTCSKCNRPVCPDHYKLQEGGSVVCLDCFGKQENSVKSKSYGKGKQVALLKEREDVYGYRHVYYGRGLYHPIYIGDYYDDYYDDYDIRAFDERAEYAEAEDGQSDAQLYDS
jgi:hypothetical protein